MLAGIYRRRDDLASAMRVPKRWPGLLHRNLMARAIRGSNSIEGYHVETDDAAAAVDYEEARTAAQDFKALTEIGLLAARGETRARHYVASPSCWSSDRSSGRKCRGGLWIHIPGCGSSC
ncbi:hypothetical protein NBRGN_027_01140 [Nocardia brasiliensis NBRC 14402]|uniref:hypothetical protein n=1 Tax=Nocardia brasiliensis TaxID=37326 RepID=UPI0002E74E55|nr:hypothetical protein [Nocardia brasiliensis]GAJ80458.1 hypothetical protein NBRGN_027_01140 [Nocardia brasiliensis NBRC 14402]SUB10946.1 Uncharacterised protein [Nocardia brasiliensis]